jgi:transposase
MLHPFSPYMRMDANSGAPEEPPEHYRLRSQLRPPACAVGGADRGYDADALVQLIRASGAKVHIPSTRSQLIQRSVNRRIYRQRNLVERYFNKLKHLRRVATRFEKLAGDFLTAVAMASARLRLRAYEPMI